MALKKVRVPIPKELAAKVQFLSNRTCCICTIPGKPYQIHHIDENPSNNNVANLALLCLECHELTMIRGGFGRKLDADQIIINRDSWLKRVVRRRRNADKLASMQSIESANYNSVDTLANLEEQKFVYNTDGQMLRKYLEKIIVINKAQLMIAETNWASGITAEMIQGGYDMVSFYEEVLCEVASFLSERHFEGGNPRDLFSKIIHSKYNWYRMLVEPAADGRNGTMMLPVIPGKVMIDLKDMIANLVFALEELHGIDSKEWIKAWNLN